MSVGTRKLKGTSPFIERPLALHDTEIRGIPVLLFSSAQWWCEWQWGQFIAAAEYKYMTGTYPTRNNVWLPKQNLSLTDSEVQLCLSLPKF